MKNSFIIGIVWTAVIVGILSFGATIFFLENNNSVNQNEIYDKIDVITAQQSVYITDESSIRTNNVASLTNNTMATNGVEQVNSMQNNMANKENNFSNKSNNDNEINDELLNNMDELLMEDLKMQNSETQETISPNVNSFISPVKGEVLKPLSINELIYSKTLQEWNIHTGTDYKAQLGDEVYAIRSGKIKEINFNQEYGDYIVIEHDEKYESLYSNITALDALKVGDDLKQGQVIGYVAESFGFEVAEQTHLHFELKRNGEFVSI